jgi:hypothetical protein
MADIVDCWRRSILLFILPSVFEIETTLARVMSDESPVVANIVER